MQQLSIVLVSILGTATFTMIGKALYDRRANSTNSNVPHAKNGFMTAAETEAHCDRRQLNCSSLIKAEIRLEFSNIRSEIDHRLNRIDSRLAAGDKLLDRLEDKLED